MPNVSFRVTTEEKNIMEGYAKVQGISLTDAIKNVFFQMIEDEYDLKCIKEHRAQKKRGDVILYTHDEIKKDLGFY
jgi:hypothetical protein